MPRSDVALDGRLVLGELGPVVPHVRLAAEEPELLGPLSSDLDVLADEGVPTLSPVVDSRRYFDWHHTAADTLDKIDLRELRENAAVVAVLTYALAAMDGALPRASTGGAE